MKERIIVGSRDSKLAVVQSNMLVDYIKENFPQIQVELLTMKTTGDIKLEGPLYEIGGKGLFVKELDLALEAGKTDLSVHSLKDMPMEVPEELPLIGFSKREDPRDVLVLPEGKDSFPENGKIGSSSLRRNLQLKKIFPNATIESVRGNVQTRLGKLDSGQFDAIVLAAAGLKRLGLENRIYRYFETDEILPAAGQGILAVQGRKGMDYSFLQGFFDKDAGLAAIAERAYIKEVNGGCSSPMAAHAVVDGSELTLQALYYHEDSGSYSSMTVKGDKNKAKELGIEAAQALMNSRGDYE